MKMNMLKFRFNKLIDKYYGEISKELHFIEDETSLEKTQIDIFFYRFIQKIYQTIQMGGKPLKKTPSKKTPSKKTPSKKAPSKKAPSKK